MTNFESNFFYIQIVRDNSEKIMTKFYFCFLSFEILVDIAKKKQFLNILN